MLPQLLPHHKPSAAHPSPQANSGGPRSDLGVYIRDTRVRLDCMADYLTGVASAMRDGDLAKAVARQRLLSRLTDAPVASLSDCVWVGRAVGLSMSEMQRLTGLARQTLYRHLDAGDNSHRERRPARPQTTIEVLILLAAEEGATSPATIARRANLSADQVLGVMTSLDEQGLCTVRRDSYSSLEGAITDDGYIALREHFDELLLRQPDAIAVYIRVPDRHADAIATAAAEIFPRHEHVLMPRSTVPSVMVGPELAVPINAPTIRRALTIARDIWRELLTNSEIDFAEPAIANVIPPGTQPLLHSEVLDAFLEAIIDSGVANGDALRELRARFAGGPSEAELAGRCVTEAAIALRRIAGNADDPRPIVDGDSAFAELQPAEGVPVPREAACVQEAVVTALRIATDRLGPLPGGRLGSFRAPGGAPNIVATVRPTTNDLVRIAQLSGEALGNAALQCAVAPVAVLSRVVSSGTAAP